MEKMPDYKEGHITIWRNGAWVQLTLEEMQKIVAEDEAKLKLRTTESV